MPKGLKAWGLFSLAPFVLAVVSAQTAHGSYRDEGLRRIDTLEEKFVGLAETMPQDKYTWRPMEGVRSVSEEFLHVAAVNFGLSRVFGTPPPEGFNMRGYERSTSNKAEIVASLKESFEHFRGAIEKLSDADGDKAVKMFGREMTTRGALWNALEHLSEHLGKLISNARSNQVVPPWTAAREGN